MVPNLTSGTVLGHSYRLLHPIGEGGMGRVWVAEHMSLDRRVAIKVMSEEALATPVARELFDREARATAKVESPHVVRVLDFDVTEDGFPFLVLELLTGETLEERIVQSGPLSVASAEALLEQVSHALGAAHACGILHRDMKAENIFLVGNDRTRIDVRLLDFGIATTKESTALLAGPVGTLCYMSPEQTLAADVDERSDLFSLAICMYYALTGRFPFEGSTIAEVSAAFTRMCPPVTAFRTDLPGSLDAWFARALARDRHARFSSATEMCEAFKHPLHRRTPITHEIEIEEHDLVAAGVPRRHLARWALAFAAVAGIVMGVTHTRELGKRIAQARAGAARDESAEGAIMPVERQVTPIRLPHGYTPSVPPTRSISTTARTVVAVVRHHATHDAKIATMASPDPSAAKPLVKEDPSDLPDFGGRE